jgi:hypothetical protein
VAEKLYYDRRILNSKNKMKTTWNIIKTETGKKFLTIVDNIIASRRASKTDQSTHDNYLNYILQTHKGPLPNIRFRHTSTCEIEEIIKSVKLNIHMDMMRYQL